MDLLDFRVPSYGSFSDICRGKSLIKHIELCSVSSQKSDTVLKLGTRKSEKSVDYTIDLKICSDSEYELKNVLIARSEKHFIQLYGLSASPSPFMCQ